MPPIILASGAPRRKELLQMLIGDNFTLNHSALKVQRLELRKD